MKEIAPSILSADGSRLGAEIAAVEAAGADMIHIDVMDGHFVPNLTVGPAIVKSLSRVTSLKQDVHLMIESPDRYLSAFVDAGADIVTVHQEVCPHLHRALQRIRELGDIYCWGDLAYAQAFNPDIRLEFEGRQAEGWQRCRWIFTLNTARAVLKLS